MQLLRANTEIKVRIGSFVDVTDGFTPETGVDLSTADEAELLKNNGAATVSLAAATWAAVTGSDGWYNLTLTTGHTDTEGLLTVVVQDDSVCLPVAKDFMVMSEAAFDSMFAAKDTGYMDVNVKALGDTVQSATNLKDLADTGYDPATHKVQGVVLVDTTTTNTDMRGTDSAATAALQTTMDNKLDAIAGYIDTEVAAIKAVTDNLPDSGALTSLATAAELAKVKGATAGKTVISAAGDQVLLYDAAGTLLVTLDRTGTGPYTWTPTWA